MWITFINGSLSVLIQSIRGLMMGLNLPGSEEREMRAPAIQLRILMLSCCCSSWSWPRLVRRHRHRESMSYRLSNTCMGMQTRIEMILAMQWSHQSQLNKISQFHDINYTILSWFWSGTFLSLSKAVVAKFAAKSVVYALTKKTKRYTYMSIPACIYTAL